MNNLFITKLKSSSMILMLLFISTLGHSQSDYWKCQGNCIDGRGVKNWKDGGVEKGTWVKGELYGKGYAFFGDKSEFAGDSYEGDFLNGYHGVGTYIDVSKGAIYVGEFKNGAANGKGRLTFNKDSEFPNRYYDGNWVQGKRQGHGLKFWGESGEFTNNKYVGEWNNDDQHGFGRYDWADGSYFVGEWKLNEMDGPGVYTFPNGDTLASTWNNGYCRELALILYGESPSTFKSQVVEINGKGIKSAGNFIGALTGAFGKLRSEPTAKVDLKSLKKFFKISNKDNLMIMAELSKVKEFDRKIEYKKAVFNTMKSYQEVLNEFDAWFKIMDKEKDFRKAEKVNNKIFEKFSAMKQTQLELTATEKKFNKKHID